MCCENFRSERFLHKIVYFMKKVMTPLLENINKKNIHYLCETKKVCLKS
jgi:hypothetical protein